jgi:hypothetical protein
LCPKRERFEVNIFPQSEQDSRSRFPCTPLHTMSRLQIRIQLTQRTWILIRNLNTGSVVGP